MVSIIQGFDELRDSSGALLTPLGFGFQSDWEVLGRVVANGDATLDTGGWDATLYDEIEISCLSMVPSSDGVSLQLRVSVDGGATYEAGASDYPYAHRRMDLGAAPAQSDSGSVGTTQITLSDANGTAAGESSTVKVFSGLMHTSGLKLFHFQNMARLNDGTEYTAWGGAAYVGSGVVDGFQLRFSTGNVASGVFVVRGRRATPVSLISQDDWVVIHDDEAVVAAVTHDYFWDDNVYDEIEVTITAALTGTDIRDLAFRISSDGSTFHSGSTDYKFAFHNYDENAGSNFANSSVGAPEAVVFSTLGDQADELVDAVVHLTGVSNSARKQKWKSDSFGPNSNTDMGRQSGGGYDTNTNDRTQGIQLRSDGTATLAFDRVRIRGRRLTPTGVLKQDWEVLATFDHDDTGDVAEIEFKGIPVGEFDEFELVLKEMNTGTTPNTMILQFSDDGGATWDTGSNYQYAHLNRSAETAYAETFSAAETHIVITANFGAGNERVANMILQFGPLDGPADRNVKFVSSAINDSDNMRSQDGAGRWEAHTGPTTAFRLDLSAGGNFTGGRGVLRGRRKQ